MNSNIFDRGSFIALMLTAALMSVFFVPAFKIPVEISKGLLAVLGLGEAGILWATARFWDGRIVLPKSLPLLGAVGVSLAFLVSAIFSPAVAWSLFGVMFSPGSFFFILVCFLLLFFGAVIVRGERRGREAFLAVALAFAAVLAFQTLRLFAPAALSFG